MKKNNKNLSLGVVLKKLFVGFSLETKPSSKINKDYAQNKFLLNWSVLNISNLNFHTHLFHKAEHPVVHINIEIGIVRKFAAFGEVAAGFVGVPEGVVFSGEIESDDVHFVRRQTVFRFQDSEYFGFGPAVWNKESDVVSFVIIGRFKKESADIFVHVVVEHVSRGLFDNIIYRQIGNDAVRFFLAPWVGHHYFALYRAIEQIVFHFEMSNPDESVGISATESGHGHNGNQCKNDGQFCFHIIEY